jgi:hypothetical protein
MSPPWQSSLGLAAKRVPTLFPHRPSLNPIERHCGEASFTLGSLSQSILFLSAPRGGGGVNSRWRVGFIMVPREFFRNQFLYSQALGQN